MPREESSRGGDSREFAPDSWRPQPPAGAARRGPDVEPSGASRPPLTVLIPHGRLADHRIQKAQHHVTRGRGPSTPSGFTIAPSCHHTVANWSQLRRGRQSEWRRTPLRSVQWRAGRKSDHVPVRQKRRNWKETISMGGKVQGGRQRVPCHACALNREESISAQPPATQSDPVTGLYQSPARTLSQWRVR